MKPFTKWVGGKRQLLKPILKLLPDNFNHYYELFIGGGAILLELAPNQASINDKNTELVLAYNVVKHHVEELIVELKTMHRTIAKIIISIFGQWIATVASTP